MRTANEREALQIMAEILTPRERLVGEGTRRDTNRDVRDVAARACGLVHRNGYLLTRLPAAVRLRGRNAVPEDAPCLITSLE